MRRLVICFDGTWNTPDKGENPTNVVKMVRAVRIQGGGVPQITFYDKGVGTGGPIDRITGGASGAGLTENIIDGYRFLANNFATGDEIYVFGFSRGAYTARSLVGLISMAGLLAPIHLGAALKDDVLGIYRDKDLNSEQKRQMMADLNLTRHENVRIRCIGVWDTVGALGIPTELGRMLFGKKCYFHDVELSGIVDIALHAVAIDEKRGSFPPALWVKSDDAPPPDQFQVVEQVWFPGVHSNVGGSYADTGLSDIAFEWMAKRVEALTGLALDTSYIEKTCTPAVVGTGYENRSLWYKSSVLYPYQRLINQVVPPSSGFWGWFRKKFKSLDRRNIAPPRNRTVNESVHISAIERWNLHVVRHDCKTRDTCTPRPYRPVNLEAVLHAYLNDGLALKIIGWDGVEMKACDVPFPKDIESFAE